MKSGRIFGNLFVKSIFPGFASLFYTKLLLNITFSNISADLYIGYIIEANIRAH